MTRRSTKTVIVLSPLSLTTTPCKIRRGIAVTLLRRRLRLNAQDRFDSRDVAANLTHARRVLELAAGLLEAQVELLLAQADQRLKSEESCEGTECVCTCRSRWSPYHSKKTQ